MKLSKEQELLAADYSHITNNQNYLTLKDIPRHSYTNTYDHSVRVAYLAGKMAAYIRADVESTIKTALLHDFCLVNYYEENDHPGWYLFYHPVEAVENSEPFELTKKEKRAILSHMFPMAMLPTSKIGWMLVLSDKMIAVYEKTYGMKKIRDKSVYFLQRLAYITGLIAN